MKKSSKILATLGMVATFFILFGIITVSSKSKGGGILGIILLGATIAGIRVVWKSNPE